MDFSLSKEQIELETRCREFAQNKIAPFVTLLEENIAERLTLFKEMGKHGFFLLALPKNEGGTGIGTIGYLMALKAIAKADAGIAVAMAVTNMVGEAIAKFGSENQRKKYLSNIAKGQSVPLSFALTEKQAGSDVKAMMTTFTEDPNDGGYIVLKGDKQFITNGDIAETILVMAKGQCEGREGISAFLIDKNTPGLSVTKKENKLGLLTANLVSLHFENCRLSIASMLGAPNQGLTIALASLDSGRLGIAAQALGISEAAYEAAVEFSKTRVQFGHPIVENQAIGFKLADMKVKLDAGRLLMHHAGWIKDLGRPFSIEAAEAKLFCSEKGNEIVADALQIHGGYGYIKDYPLEKYYRDIRVTTLYEGTSEIQRIVISRSLVKVTDKNEI